MSYYIDEADLEELTKSEDLEEILIDHGENIEEFFDKPIKLEKKTLTIELLTDINESLKSLKRFMIYLLLNKEKNKMKSNKDIKPIQKHKISLDHLDDIATTRKNNNTTEYLLHRGTLDYEYENNIEEPNHYIINDLLPFYAYSDGGEELRQGNNPVVSIWVPKDKIQILTPREKTGTWKELGENPHQNKYKVNVLPGKYEIYKELNT